MKKNRIAILLVVILGSLSTWLIFKNTNSTARKELQDFAVADTASITKIHLKNKADKEVTLDRMPGGRWKLNGKYYARPDAVQTLLTTIKRIRVRNQVPRRAQDEVIKSLATGSTLIQIYADDKLIKAYYVGGETQDMEGTNMLLQDPETGKNSTTAYVLSIPGFNGYVSGRYFCDEGEWRDRTVFHYPFDEIKTIQADYSEHKDSGLTVNVLGVNDFEVKYPNGNKIQKLDTGLLKLYIGFYFDVQYEGMERLRPGQKDSVLARGWVHSITVTTKDGKSSNIRTYYRPAAEGRMNDDGTPMKWDNDRMYAVMNGNTNEILSVQYYVFGRLFMTPDHFTLKSGKKKASL